MKLVKISASSAPKRVAGAVAGILRENECVTLRAIGPHAVNQAVKSLAVARQYLAQDGLDLTCQPEFDQVVIDEGEPVTAIKFTVRRQ